MAKFRYIYRTRNQRRLEAEIEAGSRDEAFSLLRQQDIRPIKVIAMDGSKENGVPPQRNTRRGFVWSIVALLAGAGGVAAFVAGRNAKPEGSPLADKNGTAPHVMATPLARQAIPGNRTRIADAMNNAFETQTEKTLALFAEPGREFYLPDAQPSQEDLKKALGTPLIFAPNELSETIDLKRIVAGMKRELSVYVSAGGTWNDYVEQLVKRQKLEISYRQNASQKIHAALDGEKPDKAKAYDLWLKANAQLQSMGIYPIVLPDSLWDYQMSVDLDE